MLYPSKDAVLRLHGKIIEIAGGEQGFVSQSNLAYVLETVKDIGGDLPEEGAVIRKSGYLLFNLINLHPFLDGNKRTAFEVTKTFLKLNGWRFEPAEDAAFTQLLSVSKRESDPEATELWIARNLSRRAVNR